MKEEFREVRRLIDNAEADYEEYEPDQSKSDRIEALDSALAEIVDAGDVLDAMEKKFKILIRHNESYG